MWWWWWCGWVDGDVGGWVLRMMDSCCLVPVFALGRAQELLLLLDEHWQTHHHLQEIPVYYAHGMSKRALRVYQTYINMMNDHIRYCIIIYHLLNSLEEVPLMNLRREFFFYCCDYQI